LKRNPHNKLYLVLALVILIVACASFVRFYHLSELGLWDDDTLNYSSIAKKWFFDRNFINPYAKPAYHILSCIAIGLVGLYDFTLLYLSNFLDIISILLIVLIARMVGIRWTISISASMLYAFLPFILKEATRALPHLSSSTFSLAAICLFLAYLNSGRRYRTCLFFCGFLAAFSANLHPTLLSGFVFFFLILTGFALPRFNPTQDRLKGLKDFLSYLSGFVSVYFIFILIVAANDLSFLERITDMITKLFKYRGMQGQGHRGSLISKFGYTFSIMPEMFTKPVAILVAFVTLSGLGLFVQQWKPFSKDKIAKEWSSLCADKKAMNICLLLGIMGFFLLTFVVAINGIQARFMIPIVPLVILGLAGGIELISPRYPKLRLGLVFVVFSLLVSVFNVVTNIEMIKKPAVVSRQIANVLYKKVDANNRVLVMPKNLHQSYIETIYLDGNFVYHLRRIWKPRLKELKRFNVRYIVVVKPKSPYSLSNQNIKLTNVEYGQIMVGIAEMGATPMYESDKVLIVEVPGTSALNNPFRTPRKYPFFWVTRLYEPVGMK